MRNKLFFCFLLSAFAFNAFSQKSDSAILSLKLQLMTAKNDTARAWMAAELALGYRFSHVDSSLLYNDLALSLVTKLNLLFARGNLLSLKGSTLLESGKIPEAMQQQYSALQIAEEIKDSATIASALNGIGNTYMELAEYSKANDFYRRSKDLFRAIGIIAMYYNELSNIGNIFELMGMPDSALYYQRIVYEASIKTKDREFITRAEMMFRMGNAYKGNGNTVEALRYYRNGISEAYIDNDIRNLSMNHLQIAKLYHDLKRFDSSRKYAFNSLATAGFISFRKGLYEASSLISELFRKNGQYDSAYKYLAIANAERDSLTGPQRFQELQRIVLEQQEHQRHIEFVRTAERNRQLQYGLSIGLGLVLFVAFILYRNNKQKQKANLLLGDQKKQIEATLTELSSTQAQLIQSEKMASLGELTAGIAHEIQNPLNFVNNFSEVNKELLAEMDEEMVKGNYDEVRALAKDVSQNEEKINHHGRRADAIVKGMLQHSRTNNVQREPTDINALADEYLRLAYHGFRAKDKSCNALMETDFDGSIGMINIIPQDIGRVLLNLFTNAFYSVQKKKEAVGEGFKPLLRVSTKKTSDGVSIVVEDNGGGISGAALSKIYQPFFTTKPTGEGTGLGLSMSYDIITKGHGGQLTVHTEEGSFARFNIFLPA
jgi:two-component system NtrC family sensor kinase